MTTGGGPGHAMCGNRTSRGKTTSVFDDEVIDVRTSAFRLTPTELALLRAVVDRGVIDVADLGRTLGTSDEGVYAAVSSIAEKFTEFRHLVANRTPPLGVEVTALVGRRAKHRRPIKPDAAD